MDWVVLVTSEVLRGRLSSLRKDSLSFDSDQLGELTLDWADVASLQSSRGLIFVDDQLREQIGPGLVTPETVAVRGPSGVVRFPRSRLLSIVPHDEDELGHWGLRANIGATVRRGNSDTIDLSGALQLRRQDSLTRLLLDSNAAYGEVSGERTVQQTAAAATFDVYLSRSFYLRPVFATTQTDHFKNVSFRGTAGAGGGWTLLDRAQITCDLDVGAGYQYTNYESAPVGTNDPDDAAVVLLGTRLETEFYPGLELDVVWRSFVAVTDLDQTYHQGSAALAVDAHDAVEAKLTVFYDRVEGPVPDEDGVRPKKDDVRVVASVGVDLW